MSNEEDRKSMDDVLASIRRIVRAEKEPEAPEKPAEPVADPVIEPSPEPAPAVAEMVSPPPATAPTPPEDSVVSADAPAAEVDAPLALTSDMRMDETEEGSVVSQAICAAASSATDVVQDTVGEAADGLTGLAAAATTALSADPEQLKDMVRDVIREELTSSDAAGEAIRAIIRDELMSGEIGRNISQNVLMLIQAEVAKAAKSN